MNIEAKSITDGYLKPGTCVSNDGLDGFVRKIAAHADRPGEDIIFRLDKGQASGAILDTIEELGTGYVAKAKLTSTIMGRVSRIKKWGSIGNVHFAANFKLRLSGWSNARRFTVIERNLPPARPNGQMLLFDMLEGHLMSGHVHMCLKILSKYSVSYAIGFLKGKSAVRIHRWILGSKKLTGLNFWARGYYVGTVGLDESVVRQYIRNQEKHAQQMQLDLK